MSKSKLDPVGPLVTAAVSIYQSDEHVAALSAQISRDIRKLESWASDGSPERALCAGLALAVLARDVEKASQRHFEGCIERIRKWKS